MSETTEPSYYEIALTNRQVLASFVVLLSCVMAAFVSGVWVGRKDAGPLIAGDDQLAAEVAEGDLERLDEFKFFTEKDGARADSGLEKLAAEPKPGTTLAEDVGSAPPPPTAPPPRTPTAPPPRAAPPPPAARPPAPVVTAGATAPKEGFIIQVLSTRDQAKADRILNQLSRGGYPAFLSPVDVGSQVQYRVRIGPYSDRPAAEKAAQEVNTKYKLDTWVTAASN